MPQAMSQNTKCENKYIKNERERGKCKLLHVTKHIFKKLLCKLNFAKDKTITCIFHRHDKFKLDF